MKEKGVTKVFRFYTPSLAKRNSTVRWNWSNESDGVRVFEAWCKDTTGHNFLTLRITRNTEEEIYDELEGQITDGYFENYYGPVRYTKMSDKYRVQVRPGIFTPILRDFIQSFNGKSPAYAYTLCNDFRATVLALLHNLEPDPTIIEKRLKEIHLATDKAYRALYGWEAKLNPTDKEREEYTRCITMYRRELKYALEHCETRAMALAKKEKEKAMAKAKKTY